jgi:predicted RNase H-like nuclease (RuvC/YqgF family)
MMRKFLISGAVAATALTAAVPAAAQYGQQPYAPYGQAYGYNNYGQIRSLEARVVQLQREIQRLDQRNVLSNREASRLRAEAYDIRNDLRRAGRDGFNQREASRFHNRVAQLEVRIQREARDWNNRNNRYGDRNWSDRDRDGRDDRYEDDRGRDHD